MPAQRAVEALPRGERRAAVRRGVMVVKEEERHARRLPRGGSPAIRGPPEPDPEPAGVGQVYPWSGVRGRAGRSSLALINHTAPPRRLTQEDHHVPHHAQEVRSRRRRHRRHGRRDRSCRCIRRDRQPVGGTLYVNAQPGETNNMRVTLTNTYLEILENNSGGVQPQAGTTCITFSPGHARCNLTRRELHPRQRGRHARLRRRRHLQRQLRVHALRRHRQRLPRRHGHGRQPRVHPRRGRRRPALRPPVRRHDLRRQRRRHHRRRRRRRLAQRRPGRRPHRRRRGQRLHLRQGLRTRDYVQCGTGSDWAQVDRTW